MVKSSRHRRADRGPTCPIASLPRHRPRCDLPNCVSPEAPTENELRTKRRAQTETRRRRTPKTLSLASSARYFLLAHATTATIDRSKKKEKKERRGLWKREKRQTNDGREFSFSPNEARDDGCGAFFRRPRRREEGRGRKRGEAALSFHPSRCQKMSSSRCPPAAG